MKRCLRLLFVTGFLLGLATETYALEQNYSRWKYCGRTKRYTCTCTYQKTPQAAPETQTIVYYPQAGKDGWIYFYNNAKQKYWGRCASPTHSQYSQSQMKWSYLQANNEWGKLTNTCPPVPGTKSGPAISSPPPPPGI